MSNKSMELGELIHDTTLSFARYTITDRAIPKASDGLKSIHRRIIYSMYDDKVLHDKYRQKSVNVAGSVLRFSPHGDSSVYDAMVRLANDSVNYNLIDGKGAFGTITSKYDNGGASRYTESRLGAVTQSLLNDINKDAVDFVLNYDETRKEPTDLPAQFPMILANPNLGIAMGISTKIPSFDLKDIRDNVVAILSNKELKPMYPTFATGGYVLRDEAVAKEVQDTGRGSFRMRAKYHIDGDNIIITELPYGSQIETIIDRIIDLKSQNEPEMKFINNVNDDTNKDGLKLRIETKKNTDKEMIMSYLYKKTALEANFPCNMYVLDNNNAPKLWGTKDILTEWIKFRANTIKRITLFDIEKLKKRLNILQGLEMAVNDLDKVIQIIKDSEESEVVSKLIKDFGLNEEQAKFISELKLKQLNKTYIDKQIKDIAKIEKELIELEKLANSKKLIAKEIIKGIDNSIKHFYVDRKTEIVDEFTEYTTTKAVEAINDYNVRVIITNDGYLKKLPATSLRGKHKIKYKDGDYPITDIWSVNSEEVLVFTDSFDVYKINLSDLSDTKPSELGVYIPSQLGIDQDTIYGIVPLNSDISDILFAYEDGKVAKVETNAYRTKQNRSLLKNGMANKKALKIVGLSEDFDLVSISEKGKVILLNTKVVNSKASKTTQGVAFQKLKDNDIVKDYRIINQDDCVEDLEYYRVANAGVGKNNRGDI